MANGYVYAVEFETFVKVGSTKDFNRRISSLRGEVGQKEVSIYVSEQLKNYKDVERLVLDSLSDFHVKHERCKNELFIAPFGMVVADIKSAISRSGRKPRFDTHPDFATSIRIPESLKKKVEEKAKEEGRTLNNMLNQLIKRAVQ